MIASLEVKRSGRHRNILMDKNDVNGVVERIMMLSNPKRLEGMSRYGINTKNALGVSVYELRMLAKELRVNHELALELWNTGIHEAMLLAGMIEDAGQVSDEQVESWLRDFDSWDIVDITVGGVFDRLPKAYEYAISWTMRDAEFERRAGYVMMCALAVHDKKAKDEAFLRFFPYIKAGACDSRNFVKKAVNWSIRQIGKRSQSLNEQAVRLALEIRELGCAPARWIANDALRELNSPSVKVRLNVKKIIT